MLVGMGGHVSSKLEQVMQYAEFQWAAMYVITDAGQIVFMKSMGQDESPHASFQGGVSMNPTNILVAIAKLRRELADESSITLYDVNCVRMSPFTVLPDGLVQIAMIKQAWMYNQRCWVLEARVTRWSRH